MTAARMSKLCRDMWCRFKNLLRDRRAVAAVEFVLIVPLLMVLWIGVDVLNEMIAVRGKLDRTANAVADIIAQESTITSRKELTDLLILAESMMLPYPTGPLEMLAGSVKVKNATKATVDWSAGLNRDGLKRGASVSGKFGASMSADNIYMIYVRADYSYSSHLLGLLLTGDATPKFTFTSTRLLRPRSVDRVLLP